MLELKDTGPVKRKIDILSKVYARELILSKEQLNDNLSQLIQGDQVMALYIMNQMLRFLYPCKVWIVRNLERQRGNLETRKKDITKEQPLKYIDN